MAKRTFRGKPKKTRLPGAGNLMAQVQEMQEKMAAQREALADETVTVKLVVSNEAARQIVDGQLHELRQTLADAGISFGSFDVTTEDDEAPGGRQSPEAFSGSKQVNSPRHRPGRSISPPRRPTTGQIDVVA